MKEGSNDREVEHFKAIRAIEKRKRKVVRADLRRKIVFTWTIRIPASIALSAASIAKSFAEVLYGNFQLASIVFSALSKMSSLCMDSPLAALKLLRWFVPRNAREEIDLAVADLKEDRRDMKKQKQRTLFIFTVLAWHCIRIIASYTLDSIVRILQKILPFASVWVKGK